MKIVQAFVQGRRESERFAGAVEDAFATARRRIRLRAAMTAIVITLMFGSITLVMWQAALEVAAGRIRGGTIAAFVFTGSSVVGGFGVLHDFYGPTCCGSGGVGGGGTGGRVG